MKMKQSLSIFAILCFCALQAIGQDEVLPKLEPTCVNQDTLVVLWTTQDKDVSMNMILYYTGYAPEAQWWKEIIIIVWGPSNKLLAQDAEVQEKVKKMQEDGIKFFVCKGCADRYGLSDELESLGLDVQYVGEMLTNYIKKSYPILTF